MRTNGSLRGIALGVGAMLALAAGAGCDFTDRGGGGHSHGPGGGHADHDAGAHAHAEGEHDHGDGGRSVAVTVWGERFEVFLEHEVIVVGAPVRFVTHVTDLSTLEPRRKGPVTFLLQRGAEPLEHVEPAPARDGIYIPTLTFPAAGAWNIALRVPIDGGTSTVDLGTFAVHPDAATAAAAALPAAPHGISFLKEQQWRIPTSIHAVERRELVERIVVAGRVEARASGRAVVTSPVAGHLMRPSDDADLPTVGERVAAGQIVARVAPPLAGSDLLTFAANRQQIAATAQQLALARTELATREAEASAAVAQASAALANAEKREAMMRSLVERNARPARDLVEAELAGSVARVALDAARATAAAFARSVAKLPDAPDPPEIGDRFPAVELRAPIDGVVTARAAVEGEHILPTSALFEILDASEVEIEAHVPEADLPRLGADPSALAAVPGESELRPITGPDAGGRLVALGLRVDRVTRTAPVVYEVPNPDGALRPGLALPIHVETRRSKQALAIPISAVVEEDARAVAFVMLAGETFDKRDVELGIRDGEWVEVVSGLAEGERVVTRGAYAVRLASVSTAIPSHGHAH